MDEIPPQYVIRFYGNTNYALECIALKQIAFIHVEKLNDPFDLILDFVTDFNDDYASLVDYVQKHHPTQLTLFKERLPEQNCKELIAGWSKLAKRRESLFVFSTCAVEEGNHPRNNLYMWGHYGNGHRGVAIEFNTTALAKLLIKQDNPYSKSPWWKMNYTKEIPKIKCEDIFEFEINSEPDPNNLESYGPKLKCVIDKRIRSKGEIWKNENEWRLVWENDETKLKIHRYELPDNAITAVYLGCHAAEKEQLRNDFVYETQRNFPSASVFRAKMRKGEYALDFEKIV
ncbi:MAG: DUF2971 domain-containing protein [Nitrospinae bacterium]|nr:DUF2971 domain-containing protein [Nitrospinota bacterium]